MDQIKSNETKWYKVDQMEKIGPNGPNKIKVDQIGPKWIPWTERDEVEPNWTKVNKLDRIGLK